MVPVEPEKTKWDIVWSYSVFETNFGDGQVPYNFSDLIAVNYLAGVQVKVKSMRMPPRQALPMMLSIRIALQQTQ